jgi:Flp pilus assembly pilin Flp
VQRCSKNSRLVEHGCVVALVALVVVMVVVVGE